MKPTKEQIEAALQHSDYLTTSRVKSDTSRTLLEILAAAYRELMAENEELKTKSCDFCNEPPQTEAERYYLEKYGDAKELPSHEEWQKEKQELGLQ